MTYDICKNLYIHQMLLTYRFLIVMVCFLCFGPPSFRHPSHTNCRFGRSLSRLRSQHDRQFRRDAKRVIKQNSKKKTSSLDYRASYKWIQWADLKPVLDSLMTHWSDQCTYNSWFGQCDSTLFLSHACFSFCILHIWSAKSDCGNSAFMSTKLFPC